MAGKANVGQAGRFTMAVVKGLVVFLWHKGGVSSNVSFVLKSEFVGIFKENVVDGDVALWG